MDGQNTDYDKLAGRYGVKLPENEKPKKPAIEGADVASVLDDEFKKLGYSNTARLSILGDVGRENGWNRNTIFQGHKDPKNNAFNRGIFSYQGDRGTAQEQFIRQNGGSFEPTDENLRLMARFTDAELKKDYPQIYSQIRNAQSNYEASEALRQYIKYVPDGPYNEYDPEFRVKNNKSWAEKAKQLGLARDLDYDALTERYGAVNAPDNQTDYDRLGGRYGAQPPEEPAVQPSLPPAEFQASGNETADILSSYIQNVESELARAATPARRKILQQRLVEANQKLQQAQAAVPASTSQTTDVGGNLSELRAKLQTDLENAKTSVERVQIRQNIAKLDKSISENQPLIEPSPTFPVNPIAPPKQEKLQPDAPPTELPDATEADYAEYLDYIKSTPENETPMSKAEFFAKAKPTGKENVSVGYGKDFYTDEGLKNKAANDEANAKYGEENRKYKQDLADYNIRAAVRPTADNTQAVQPPPMPENVQEQQPEQSFDLRKPTDANQSRALVDSRSSFETAKTAEEAVAKGFSKLPKKWQEAAKAYKEVTGNDYWKNSPEYLAARQAEIDKIGKAEIVHEADELFDSVLDAYNSGGTDAVRAFLKGDVKQSVLDRAKKNQETRNLDYQTSEVSAGTGEFGDSLKPRDFAANQNIREANEKTAERLTREELQSPDYTETVKNAVSASLKSVFNPLGGILHIGSEIEQSLKDKDGRLDAELTKIKDEYGDFTEYRKQKSYSDQMGAPEIFGRSVADFGRSVVKTAVSDSLKGADFIDSLIERYDPIQAIMPEEYRLNLRNLGNAMAYTVAYLRNPNEAANLKFAKAGDDVDKRLFYNIGKRIDEELGSDKYLKNLMLGQLPQAVGSGVGFMLVGLIAPNASVSTALGEFSLTSAALGGLTGAGSGYAEAKDQNLSESDAKLYGTISAITNLSEGFGIGASLNKAIKNANLRREFIGSFLEFLKQKGKSFAKGSAEESLQEFFQTTMGNVALEAIKDKDPSAYQRVLNIARRLPDQAADTLVTAVPTAALTGGFFDLAGSFNEGHEGHRVDYKNNILEIDGNKFEFPPESAGTVRSWVNQQNGLGEIETEIEDLRERAKKAKTFGEKREILRESAKLQKEAAILSGRSNRLLTEIADSISPAKEQSPVTPEDAAQAAEILNKPETVKETVKENADDSENTGLTGKTVTTKDGTTGEVVKDEEKHVQIQKDGGGIVRVPKRNIVENNEKLPNETAVPESSALLDEKSNVSDTANAVAENVEAVSEKPKISSPANPSSVSQIAPKVLTAQGVSLPDRAAKTDLLSNNETQETTAIEQNSGEKTDLQSNKKPVHSFSSTQVNLPENESKEVLSVGKTLIKDADVYTDENDPSYGREETPHVTVKYGLETENSEEVRKILESEKPFDVTLGKTSIFENADKPYDVVKIDVDSPELHRLNKLISDNAKVTDTFPDYKPHVTLAYVKKGTGKNYVGNNSLEGKKISFDSITFSSKNGETVDIPLGGKSSGESAKDNPQIPLSAKVFTAEDGKKIQFEDVEDFVIKRGVVKQTMIQRQFGVNHRDAAKILEKVRQTLGSGVVEENPKPVQNIPSNEKEKSATVGETTPAQTDNPPEQTSESTPAKSEPLPENISETWDSKYLSPPSETTTGRAVSPLPKIDANSRRKGKNTETRIDEWLNQNAIDEARSRKDDFNLRTFESQQGKKLSPADRETAYDYLFDEAWKDVGGTQQAEKPTIKEVADASDNVIIGKIDDGKNQTIKPIDYVESKIGKESIEQIQSDLSRIFDLSDKQSAELIETAYPVSDKIENFKRLLVQNTEFGKTNDWYDATSEISHLAKVLDIDYKQSLDIAEKYAQEREENGEFNTGEQSEPEFSVTTPLFNNPAKTETKDFGANNTLVTSDRAAELKRLIKQKLAKNNKQLNAGLPVDPEMMAFGAELAVYYVEGGIKKFNDFARAMVSEFGNDIKPFLKSFYGAALDYPGLDTSGMDEDYRKTDVDALLEENNLQTEENESNNVDDESERTKSDADGDRSDAGEITGDVSGSPTKRNSGNGRKSKGGSSNGNSSGDAQLGDGQNADLEQESAGENSDADNAQESGKSDSDSTGDGLSADDGKSDYLAPAGTLTREGSWRDTARRNLDILELVKRLETEDRLATPEEQQLLVKFTGWGASEIANGLFPGVARTGEINPSYAKDGWKDLAQRAKELFSPEELKAATASTRNAHYTSEKIIRGIWDAFTQFGFSQGKVLEPGMGVGLFWAAAPESVAKNSRYTGIERDTFTARIAKQILQKQAVLENDFIKQNLPDNFFDIAIGNPPFSDTRILSDKRYKKYRFYLHDYFFAKSIDKVRPGGILTFVTSKGTMDKGDTAMREYIAERADLLGAIRLPQTAFKDNAGTEVVTDVLFFRKRIEGEQPGGEQWINRAEITAQNKWNEDVTDLVNEYFVNHPEMVLGSHSFRGSMYKANEYTVIPNETDIEEDFQAAIKKLPSAVFADLAKTQEIVEKAAERDFNPKATKEGSLYIHDDGRLMRRDQGSGVNLSELERISKTDEKFLRDYVGVLGALKQALYDQRYDKDWKKSFDALNKIYDAFVKTHGRITEFTTYERTKVDPDGNETLVPYRRYKNNRLLYMDVESPMVLTLESVNEDGVIEKGAPLLKRVSNPPAVVEIKELSDALAVSLDQLGKLNLTHVAELMQEIRPEITAEEISRDLGDSVFETPTGEFQLADEYLSGFVIDKLEEAEAAAATDKKFKRNVEALLKVQPKTLDTLNITVGLGAPWIGAEYTSDFTREIIGLRGDAVSFNSITSTWDVVGATGSGSRSNRGASEDWGTADRSPQELLDAALNNKSIKITRRGDDKKTYVDAEASALANETVKRMREAFKRWIWSDAKRAADLSATYNRKYNDIAPRFFNGSHLSTPGLTAFYKLHDHQKRAVWRIIQTGNTYLAHAVGAGKTLEMIVSGMEQKRLGLISKPMYVVPGHMLKQFASEFLEAYPMANVLIADKPDLQKENRKRFVAKAALNDWDAIVITHSSFGKIRTTPETSAAVVDEMVDQMRRAIAEIDDSDRAGQRTIKDLEGRIDKMLEKFGAVTNTDEKDNVVNFEDLGVDFLYVDEAHEFRKLDFVTNRTGIKGIDSKGSQMALDLQIKLRWLDSQRPGRSAVLASGTPITNTLAELYTVMRYLDPQELADADIAHFDAWSSQFGEVASDFEMNASGKYEMVERFARFINIPELMKRARKFMDVLTLSQLGELLDLPSYQGGMPQISVVPASAEQKAYLDGELDRRLERSKKWKPSKDEPNNPDPVIAIIGDGILSAIDMRFIDKNLPNDPNSKLNVMIDDIITHYNESKDLEFTDKNGNIEAIKGATQIVFSYRGFGKGVRTNRGFDSKAWINKRLNEGGIPISEIVWMEDLDTSTKKENAFKEMRQGIKKILIGTPQNMGTGVNVQKRLKYSKYLSPPWYPAHVEQPDGRSYRQGNQNAEILNQRYATKGTYDSTAWAMIARKMRAIEQAMSGDDSQRSVEDISESSQYGMASAVSAGDERAIQLVGLRRDVDRLQMLRNAHAQEQRTLVSDRRSTVRDIEYDERNLEKANDALKVLGSNYISSSEFKVATGNQTLEKHGEIGEALKKEWAKAFKANKGKAIAAQNEGVQVEIGQALGKIPIKINIFSNTYGIYSRLNLHLADVTMNAYKGDGYGVKDTEIADVDAVGLGTRIFNALNDVSKQKSNVENNVATGRRKLKQIDSKIGQPFADEQELYEKIAEHAQLQAEMAGEGTSVSDDVFASLANDQQAILDFESEGGAVLSNEANDKETESDEAPETLKSIVAPLAEKSQKEFYSQVERVLENSPQNKFSAEQAKGFLQNAPGVKQAELDYLGFDEFLDTKNQFTKDDLLDFVKANKISIVKVSAAPQFTSAQLDGEKSNEQELFLTAENVAENWSDGHREYDDVKNPVVRLRTNDRIKNGEKILHIEEIQPPKNENFEKMPEVLQKYAYQTGVKYALQMAATGNYDRVTITTGAQQDARGDLFSGGKIIQFRKAGINEDKIAAKYITGNNEVIGDFLIDRSEVERYFGKDVGSQILETADVRAKILDQDNAAVQNNLAALYDKIIPNVINKIAKGLAKVSDFLLGDQKVNSIKVTDELKELVEAGQPLFRIADESNFTPEEKMTLREMSELRYAPIEELLSNKTKAEVFGDRLQLNPHSHELLRRTLEDRNIRLGKIKAGTSQVEGMFKGVFLEPKIVKDVIDILREKAAEAKEKNYDASEIAVINDLANAVEKAAALNGTVNAIVFDKALPEEVFHQADFLGAVSKNLSARHSEQFAKILDSHPAAKKLWSKYFSKFDEYTRIKSDSVRNAVIRAEMVPFLREMTVDELADYGITEDQRADYIYTWFEGYVDKNGLEALKYFEREELNLGDYLEKIKQAYAEKTGFGTAETNGKTSNQQSNPPPKRSGNGGISQKVEPARTAESAAAEPDRSAEKSGVISAGTKTVRGFESDGTPVEFELSDGQRLASLPATLRRAGIDAADFAYDVFGDRAAKESAEKIINERGIEDAMTYLADVQNPDADHAFLSFMMQRMFLDKASEIESTNPKDATHLRELALKIGRDHALKAIKAGRFTRAASVILNSVEGVIYAVNEIVNDTYDGKKSLSPERLAKIEAIARRGEENLAKLQEIQKEKRNLKAKNKRLQDKLDGKTPTKRKRSKSSLKARAKIVDAIKEAHGARIDALREKIKANLSAPETLKSIAGNAPETLKQVAAEPRFTNDEIADFAEVGAYFLSQGLEGTGEYTPQIFHAEMVAEFGDAIKTEFQEIYQKAWELRDQWLNDLRFEKTKDRIQNKYDEELDDAEILEILGEEKAVAARKRAIEKLHKTMSGGKKMPKYFEDHKKIIGNIAPDTDTAVAAVLLAGNNTKAEIYEGLAKHGIKDEKQARILFREAAKVLADARQQLKTEHEDIRQQIAETAGLTQSLKDLEWKARKDQQEVRNSVADELRRIKQGELSYGYSQVVNYSNAFRTMMASFDLSAALRQGGFFSLSNPELQKESFKTQFSSFTEKGFGRNMMAIEANPYFIKAQRAKIDFAVAGRMDDESMMGEELYRGNQTIEKLPLIGTLIEKGITGWSERTYSGFLDAQRMTMFEHFSKELESAGFDFEKDTREFKKMAEFINVATGRGKTPGGKAGQLLLDLPFFAPRYTLSRLQLLNMTLNPVSYYRQPPGTRKIIAKSAARFYGTTATIIGIAALLGLTSFDPDDDNFLKVKVGNSRFDIFAGTLQPARMLLRIFMSGLRTKFGTDNRLTREFGADVYENLARYVRGKMSPVPSLAWDYLAQEDYVGKEIASPGDVAWAATQRLIPLTFSELYDTFDKNGPAGALVMPFAVLGVGVSTYEGREEKPSTAAEKLAAKAASWSLPDKPSKDETRAQYDLTSKLKARSRRLEDVSAEVDAALKAGKITERQKAQILNARTETFLEEKAGKLSLNEKDPTFLKVWQLATVDEKKLLQETFDEKFTKLKTSGDLSPEWEEKLTKAGGEVDNSKIKPTSEKVKKMSTDKIVRQYEATFDKLSDAQKAAYAEILKEKADRAAKAGTLTDDEITNVKKVLPDYEPPKQKRKMRRQTPKQRRKAANDAKLYGVLDE